VELITSLFGGKTPKDGAVLSIAFSLQRGSVLAQILHAFHTMRQTAPSKNTDLDLSHIQPTAMFGRVMELHPLQNELVPILWPPQGNLADSQYPLVMY
jgi:hypothetical protein